MSEVGNISYAIRTIKRYEEYRMKKYWGVILILTSIIRLTGNQTFVKVGAFYFSEIFNLEYYDVWYALVMNYLNTINFLFLLMEIVLILIAIYIYISMRRILTENNKLGSSRYVHYGVLLILIPVFSALGTSCYYFLTRFIYDSQIINSFYAILDIVNIWPVLTPLLNPDSSFYLIDGAVLLTLSYYLLPSTIKTKKFKKLRVAGPIMWIISIPLLVIEQVGFWEAIDDPLIHYNNPLVWALYHHFLFLSLMIFLVSTIYCGIYAIKSGYQVLEEKDDFIKL